MGHDANGLRTSLRYPDGGKASYAYDPLDRLTSVTFAGGTNVYSYDAVGNAVSAAFANGTRFAATYDALDRITALTDYDGAGKAAGAFSYGYDARGNITSESATGARDLRTYSYDALSRLVAVTDRETKTTLRMFIPDVTGIATPIQSGAPGFIGRGLTSGGLPEFTMPNAEIRSFDFALERLGTLARVLQ